MVEEHKEEFKHFVRIMNTDLDGAKPVYHALNKIKGIGFMFANMLCTLNGLDKRKKIGYLSKQEIEVLENSIRFGNPKIPTWMMNRRKDVEDGLDKHIVTSDMKFIQENDVKLMKKIKTRRGLRHAFGLPVRGQNMRSNFRKNKGKVQGVKRKGKVAAK